MHCVLHCRLFLEAPKHLISMSDFLTEKGSFLSILLVYVFLARTILFQHCMHACVHVCVLYAYIFFACRDAKDAFEGLMVLVARAIFLDTDPACIHACTVYVTVFFFTSTDSTSVLFLAVPAGVKSSTRYGPREVTEGAYAQRAFGTPGAQAQCETGRLYSSADP